MTQEITVQSQGKLEQKDEEKQQQQKQDSNQIQIQIGKQESTINKVFYYTLVFFSIAIGLFGLISRIDFDNWSNFNSNWQGLTARVGARLHFIFAPIWIILGVFQFFKKLRFQNRKIHVYIGRFYVFSCLIQFIGVWFIVFISRFGFWYSGFPLLVINISAIVTIIIAMYLIIVKKDIQNHQKWMIRNYACACAAISLRLLFILQIFLSEKVTYTIACWGCYPITLIVSEIWIYYNYTKQY